MKRIIRDIAHYFFFVSLALAGLLYLVNFKSPITNCLLVAAASAVILLATKWLHAGHPLTSQVAGYEGPCAPTWLNQNQIDYMFNGAVTGFFRRLRKIPGIPLMVSVGPEFHGYIRKNGTVATTEGHYSGLLPE